MCVDVKGQSTAQTKSAHLHLNLVSLLLAFASQNAHYKTAPGAVSRIRICHGLLGAFEA